MNCSRVSPRGYLKFALIVVLVAAGANAQPPVNPPLSANDVSWLFPPPRVAEDFGKLIAIRDLTVPNPQDPTKRDPVWSDTAFQQFLAIAASPAAQVSGTQSRIGLPPEAQSKAAWFIAGIRIDAGAPGLADDIRAQFGQSPEIRLIVQLVMLVDGRQPSGTLFERPITTRTQAVDGDCGFKRCDSYRLKNDASKPMHRC